MKVAAVLTLAIADLESRRGLSAVLTPDNEGLPRGLILSMTQRGETLCFDIQTSSPSTAVSTVLALLRDIALFQEVWLLSRGESSQVQRA